MQRTESSQCNSSPKATLVFSKKGKQTKQHLVYISTSILYHWILPILKPETAVEGELGQQTVDEEAANMLTTKHWGLGIGKNVANVIGEVNCLSVPVDPRQMQ